MNKLIVLFVVFLAGVGYWVFNKNTTVSKPGDIDTPPTQEISERKEKAPLLSEPTKPLEPSSKSSLPAPTSAAPSQSIQKSTTHNIAIQNFSFVQPTITVKRGDTIVWTNKDSAPHTVTGSNGGPTSETLQTNGTYSFTFKNIGTFNYICAFHPSMKGVVIVQ